MSRYKLPFVLAPFLAACNFGPVKPASFVEVHDLATEECDESRDNAQTCLAKLKEHSQELFYGVLQADTQAAWHCRDGESIEACFRKIRQP